MFWHVTWVALITALATGIGALPFAFVKSLSQRWQSLTSAFAGGMMISASVFSLADKAMHRGTAWQVISGMLLGAIFYAGMTRWLKAKEYQIGSLSVEDSRQSVLLLVVMFVHSIPEGVAVGVGYATGEYKFGFLLALAIAVHNIPEGIAVSLPLRAKGLSVLACILYSIMTSIPQPALAGPSYLLVSLVKPLLAYGLGFAGGAMIFIVVADLLPESFEHSSPLETAWGVMLGLVAMLAITSGIGL
jgi:zinc transporter ZupT